MWKYTCTYFLLFFFGQLFFGLPSAVGQTIGPNSSKTQNLENFSAIAHTYLARIYNPNNLRDLDSGTRGVGGTPSNYVKIFCYFVSKKASHPVSLTQTARNVNQYPPLL